MRGFTNLSIYVTNFYLNLLILIHFFIIFVNFYTQKDLGVFKFFFVKVIITDHNYANQFEFVLDHFEIENHHKIIVFILDNYYLREFVIKTVVDLLIVTFKYFFT